MNRTVSHHEYLMKHLTAPAEAAAYLDSVAEDGDIRFLLKAIRNVVEAQGGVGVLAKKTKLSRTTLYKTLSETGNPAVSTLDAILAVYGIRLGFFPAAREPAGRLRRSAWPGSHGGAQYPGAIMGH
ncbi:MAG: transcriptional regulator [Elusimicrobia bacterium]|nr:transcriptional regulator [Elusimicrobiota bacterium]